MPIRACFANFVNCFNVAVVMFSLIGILRYYCCLNVELQPTSYFFDYLICKFGVCLFVCLFSLPLLNLGVARTAQL